VRPHRDIAVDVYSKVSNGEGLNDVRMNQSVTCGLEMKNYDEMSIVFTLKNLGKYRKIN